MDGSHPWKFFVETTGFAENKNMKLYEEDFVCFLVQILHLDFTLSSHKVENN